MTDQECFCEGEFIWACGPECSCFHHTDGGPWSDNPRGKYWYFEAIDRCPVCGSETRFKERQYTPRPEEWEKRHEVVEAYDWCNG